MSPWDADRRKCYQLSATDVDAQCEKLTATVASIASLVWPCYAERPKSERDKLAEGIAIIFGGPKFPYNTVKSKSNEDS